MSQSIYRARRMRSTRATISPNILKRYTKLFCLFFSRLPRSIKFAIVCGTAGAVLLLTVSQSLPPHVYASGVSFSQVNPLSLSSSPQKPPKKTATPSPKNTKINASASIVRLNQLDVSQYKDTQEYNTWAYSACSAAAMTEIINAYNTANKTSKQYRITDILSTEIAVHAITADQGLLNGASSISKTVEQFGFSAQAFNKPSLDQVIQTANAGDPVIVGWPPTPGTWWDGGHVLVLKGGNDQEVFLIDSSKVNTQTLSRQEFLQRWTAGFAVTLTPKTTQKPSSNNGTYSVLGKPTITADFINQVLVNAGSPAAGKGQAMYDLGVKYGIDPVYALAFYQHESSFGTQGEARVTLSLGNLRCIPDRECIDQDRGGYAKFNSWEDGFEGWYKLIRDLYVTQLGLTTIDRIIPTYAPSADNNNEQAYIASIKNAVNNWRAGRV